MALRVWLPLNGSLENKGISDLKFVSGFPSYKVGKISSQALNLNNRIVFDCAELANLQTLSVCFWGMAEDSSTLTSNWQDLLGFSDVSSSGTGGTFRWETTYASTNGIHWHDNATNAFVNGSHTHIAQKGVWCHCCVVFDYEKGKIFTYTNGELVNTHNHLGGKFNSNGRFYLGETNNIEGRINDVRFYDHALSAKEVKEISQGLVLHYKLDGFSGGAGENLAFAPTTATNFGSSNELRTITFSGWDAYAPLNLNLTTAEWNAMVGQKITYSCWMENIEQTAGTGTGIMLHIRYADGTYQQYGGGKNGTSGSYLTQGESGWLKLTITIPDPAIRTNPTTISHVQFSIRHNSSSGASTVQYQYAKVEKGDQQTVWSPAPSEIGIDTTKIKDSSGYENDGEIYKYDSTGSIETVISDENRYNISTFINSENNTTNTAAGTCYIYGHCNLVNPIEISVAFWCKPIAGYNGGTTQGQFCLTNQTSISNCGTDYTTGTMNHYDSGIRLNGSTSSIYIKPSVTFTANSWHHYVITYDGQNGKIYKDGSLISTTAMSSATSLGSCAGVIIGFSKAGGVWRSNKSYYSDFRIYTTALSAEDILDLYHTPTNIDNLGKIHGFEFSEIYTKNLSDFSLISSNWVADGVSATYSEDKMGQIVKIVPSSGYKRIYHNVSDVWTNGKSYLVSIIARADADGAILRASRSVADFASNFTLTTSWKKYYGIITSTATANGGTLSIDCQTSTNYYIADIKLEEANKNLISILKEGVFQENWIDENNFNNNAKFLKESSIVIGNIFIEK